MGHAELQPRRYTVAEYLAAEVRSEVRHDFIDGRLLAREGDTTTHNRLVMNCMVAIRPALGGSGYRVYTLGILLVLRAGQHYAYPNLLVCPTTDGPGEPALMRQPHLLLEVLDPETAEVDRAMKFNRYRQLPSLRHYLLVWQTTQLVEWYQRTEHGHWSYSALVEASDTVIISELGVTMTLAEVYEEAGVAPMKLADSGDITLPAPPEAK